MNSSAVQRFLSMKDRHGLGKNHTKGKSSPATTTTVLETPPSDYYGLINAGEKAADAQEEQKVKALRKRALDNKSIGLHDSPILYALHSLYASGDSDKAFELLMAMSNSWEGLLMEYQPGLKLLGAENRKGVTCYLDSILFAMFSRLDSFEPMLYNTFEDNERNKLGMLLRLWVNLLRSGKLITTDITQMLQESLAECGWKEAAELHQQDASEAFTFITEKLQLPLLTLKMDIYHTGREDATDDHKFINERLLEVAIPSEPEDSERTIALEDCLEAYFNNRIEVRRYLERGSTMSSKRQYETPEPIPAKDGAVHVESVELHADARSERTLSSTCSSLRSPLRQRAPSIVRQRFVPDEAGPSSPPAYEADIKGPLGRLRSGSIRKEVMMPAWQFFSLIPWYTDDTPKNDYQVAAHFSSKRPVLGMCLKRYSLTDGGKAVRLNTRIDIPTEIGLPHFISDDSMDEDGPIYGNFKLSLQSVVCHRGHSVDSGHYISLVKGTSASLEVERDSNPDSAQDPDHWMRFDDLASERITLVDINQALKDETPYLLFYQIVPIDNDSAISTDVESLPLYAASEAVDSGIGGMSTASLKLRGVSDEMPPLSRPSVEITAPNGSPRGRSPLREQNEQTLSLPEAPSQGASAHPDPGPSQPSTGRGPTHAKGGSHSRSQSQTGERFTISLSKMTRRKSKEAVPTVGGPTPATTTNGDAPEAFAAEDERGKGFLRREGKREKSRMRLGKVTGKGKGERPDRECSIM